MLYPAPHDPSDPLSGKSSMPKPTASLFSEPAFQDDYDDLIEQARSYAQARDYDHAYDLIQDAVQQAPDRPEGLTLLGKITECLGDRLQALKFYRAALALDPTHAPAQQNLERATTHPHYRPCFVKDLFDLQRHRMAWGLFLGLCLNLAIAPTVLAMTDGGIERGTAYAIGLLGIVTLGLAVYLFAVILQPERF